MKISITGIGSEFQGVGRAEDGRAAFIHGALPGEVDLSQAVGEGFHGFPGEPLLPESLQDADRKSTRLNSSHAT